MTPPPRTWLYTPATRPDRLAGALAGPADAVIADLEDGVAPGRKDEARSALVELFRSPGGPSRPLHVRINHPSTEEGRADLDDLAAVGPALAGLRLPKAEHPDDVLRVAAALERAGSGARIHCLLETALGIERAFELATAHPRVATVGLGEADLGADLGVTTDVGFAYARSRVVVAARAARLDPPPMAVWTDMADLDGLRRSCVAGRGLGFFGRAVVHPTQIDVVHDVFSPGTAEVAAARELVARMAAAEERGDGAFALPDGRLVDRAVVESARRTLELVQRPHAESAG